MFDVIVSFDKNTFGIGWSNDLPWHFKKDLQWFYKITTSKKDTNQYDNILIVGIKTLLSLPINLKFKNRKIVVVLNKNRGTAIMDTVPSEIKKHILLTASNFNEAYYKSMMLKHNRIFVIGGETVYKQALKNNHLRYVYVGLFDFPQLTYDKYFPLNDLDYLKLIETLDKEKTYSIEMKDHTVNTTYSFGKYVLRNNQPLLF